MLSMKEVPQNRELFTFNCEISENYGILNFGIKATNEEVLKLQFMFRQAILIDHKL